MKYSALVLLDNISFSKAWTTETENKSNDDKMGIFSIHNNSNKNVS